MTTEEAVDTVARQVLAVLAADAEDQWENYPEIGEGDWADVVERVQVLAPGPGLDAYTAAYFVLQDRAEDES
jgi:hypothetical protein